MAAVEGVLRTVGMVRAVEGMVGMVGGMVLPRSRMVVVGVGEVEVEEGGVEEVVIIMLVMADMVELMDRSINPSPYRLTFTVLLPSHTTHNLTLSRLISKNTSDSRNTNNLYNLNKTILRNETRA